MQSGAKLTINVIIQMTTTFFVYDEVETFEQTWDSVKWGEAIASSIIPSSGVIKRFFPDINNADQIETILEIGGEMYLCLKDKHIQSIDDFSECGIYTICDYLLGKGVDFSIEKAISKIKKAFPNFTANLSKFLGKQQDANAPPQISANTETKALPEAKQQLLLPEKISHLKHKIVDFPNLNKELDKLGDLKEQFFKDFDELADDDILFLENNINCVDAWKRLHDCKAPDDLRTNFGAVKALATDTKSGNKRPDPSTYLSKEYIDAHMKKFKDGAACIMRKKDFIQPEDSQEIFYPTLGGKNKFVTTITDLERVLIELSGNLRDIENKLGFEKYWLGDKLDEVYIIYITPQQMKNIHLPSGNEGGANQYWIPGGFTASEDAIGIPEIIIDGRFVTKEELKTNAQTLNMFYHENN